MHSSISATLKQMVLDVQVAAARRHYGFEFEREYPRPPIHKTGMLLRRRRGKLRYIERRMRTWRPGITGLVMYEPRHISEFNIREDEHVIYADAESLPLYPHRS